MQKTSDARQVLIERFETLRAKNRSYSLRSFAKRLQMSPASLSEILSGKRDVSLPMAKKICDRLSLPPDEARQIFDSFLRLADTPEKNPATSALDVDQFRLVADWYHFAILSLYHVEGSKPDPKWIAKRLGIAQLDAVQALERLERLKLIQIEGQTWRLSQSSLAVKSSIPSSAIRKFHRQILEKAVDAVENQSLETREMGAITLAIDPDRIEEARMKLRKFRQEMSRLLETGKRTQTYVFATQLFSLENETQGGNK